MAKYFDISKPGKKCIIDFHKIPKWIESNRLGHYSKKKTIPFSGQLEKCAQFVCQSDVSILARDFGLNSDDFELDCPADVILQDPQFAGQIKIGGNCQIRCKNGKFPDPGNPENFSMSQNYVRKNIRNYSLKCVQDHLGHPIWSYKAEFWPNSKSHLPKCVDKNDARGGALRSYCATLPKLAPSSQQLLCRHYYFAGTYPTFDQYKYKIIQGMLYKIIFIFKIFSFEKVKFWSKIKNLLKRKILLIKSTFLSII